MKKIATCFASIAGLALAALPIAALSTAAHAQSAQEIVWVGDLNLASTTGKATFDQRVDHAVRHFCSPEKNLELKAACQTAVRTEFNEKAAAKMQLASRN